MKRFVMTCSLAAGLIMQSTSFAGLVSPIQVEASQNGASGGVQSARNSDDDNQYIGCAMFGATNTGNIPTYLSCSARTATGASFYCYRYNPPYQMLQAVLGISELSILNIQSDTSGICTYIYVANFSNYL